MGGHKIFFNAYLDPRAGGPSGYLANLATGLSLVGADDRIRIVPQGPKLAPAPEGAHPTDEVLRGHLESYLNPQHIKLAPFQLAPLLEGETKSIHAHFTVDALKVINSLEEIGRRDVSVILTSHCPESVALEASNGWRRKGYNSSLCDQYEFALREIEAIAFKKSDVWIFPSERAMDPYYDTIPGFADLAADKDIRFVVTGAPPVTLSHNEPPEKKRLGLEGKKVVAFMGRHEPIKGYDIFVDAMLPLVEARPDLAVVVAGRLDGVVPPSHPRWLEIGWTSSPEVLFSISDVFVLPNRRTYFDLVLIEAMAAGKAVIASATGGNISVFEMTSGALALFDGSVQSLMNTVANLIDNQDIVSDLGLRAKQAYEDYFTLEKFAKGYKETIGEIWRDYAII
ncbi:glycosyltransferase family 4 protein [Asticcacaulis sp. DW145]|uniref:glycosyltransferase family 4 protein n=1 Tax=Asticcacaulis sp. DW145 TaxID=3095608 RepID=UPI00308BB935|nr:glycosyltransferase family 4 protein [Asticcacaulis sp. DW145]